MIVRVGADLCRCLIVVRIVRLVFGNWKLLKDVSGDTSNTRSSVKATYW